MRRIAQGLLLLLFSASLVTAQTSSQTPDPEKEKAERRVKLIEAIRTDANELRLPENRAFVLAKMGSAMAKIDPERAADLFRTAVATLLEAQGIAEANKNPNHQYWDLLTSQSLRPMVLNAIATVDADYALESFYKTRPLAIQRALGQGRSDRKINNNYGNYVYLSQQEIALEQRLARLVAEQKPQRMIAILKESIKKHLSGETPTMLRKVWEKDPATGNELANDVLDRLVSKPFITTNNQVNHELVNLSTSILTEYIRERQPDERYIGFDESKLRSLAGKLFSMYIERSHLMGYIPLTQLEPITKRFSPSSYAQLKQVAETTQNSSRRIFVPEHNEEYTTLMNSNPSAETLVAEAKKFPLETRRSMYTSAASKFTDAGQYERAVALLNDNFEDDALEHAMSSLNWYRAHYLLNQGEFEAAESMIMEFNESNRISGLISLANAVYDRKPEENRSRAMAILRRTRSFIPDMPETGNDFSQLFQLIGAMAKIEPDESFRNFEPIVDQINQLIDAWAIVQRFQNGQIRQGEYLMINGMNFGLYIDQSLFRTMAQNDPSRTVTLVDGLRRRELRILMLINLLEGGF